MNISHMAGIVNNKHKSCIYDDCKKRPSYNIKGKTGIYCNSHKLDGMVDTNNKLCISYECKKRPRYNIDSSLQPLYCSAHKLDGMVNVKDKSCIYEGCKIQPGYNIEGSGTGIYCNSHKLDGMVDIKNKLCINPECKKISRYNIDSSLQPLYCSAHKLDGMVNVKDKSCIYEGCKTQPGYNIEGLSAIYCSAHKLDNMINVKNKHCKTYLCLTIIQQKYEGYCLFCYINMFPDKPITRNYKTKEYAVVEYVKITFPDLSFISDKIIANGCSKRRPDLLLDLGYQIIIVEIDENQHIDYDCSCENKRTMELSQDVGHRPIIFIRFNPDDYRNKDIIISSCWGIDKRGICSVKKTKQKEWKERLQTLTNQITYWLNPCNKTNKIIELIQLFYDI